MEERIPRKPYIVSSEFNESRKRIYEYSLCEFGYFQAELYRQKIRTSLDTLHDGYLAFPECRYLTTKSRMYRNIILDAHLIIYRITDERIEVLDIIHAASKIKTIRFIRKIRL